MLPNGDNQNVYEYVPETEQPETEGFRKHFRSKIFKIFLLLVLFTICILAIIVFMPNLYSTPDSKCSTGYTFFNETESCYKSYNNPLHFDAAWRACHSDKANLVSIHSEKEDHFVIELARSQNSSSSFNKYIYTHRIWIGLRYGGNYTWTWDDGSVVDYTNWMEGEPSDLDKDRWTSIVIDKGRKAEGQWDNQHWGHEVPFVCKKVPDFL